MSENNHFSERLREPLNETTRKARRNLMAASVIGVVITKVGLVPEKISAFGVDFTSSNQQALMTLLAATIVYFAFSFLVYVYSELTAWQLLFVSKELSELKAEADRKKGIMFNSDKEEIKFREHIRHLYYRTKPTFYLRLFVEIVIPILFAIYSSYSLLNTDIPAKTIEKPANKSSQQDANIAGTP